MKSNSRIQLILKVVPLLLILFLTNVNAGMVRGLIMDENGNPISGAAVYLIDFNTGGNINFISSDSTGKFDVSTINMEYKEIQIKVTGTTYPDQYWHPDGMVISAPDFPVKLDSNAVFTLKIILESTPATALATPSQFHGSIEGQVKEGGMPIAGLDVQLIDVMSNTPIETVKTDSFGGFIFIEVPAHNQHYLKAIPGNGVLDGYPMQYYAGMNSTLLPQVELSVPEFHTYFMGEFYVSENPPDSNSINDTTIINDSANAVLNIKLYDETTGNVLLNGGYINVNGQTHYRPDSTMDSIIVMNIPSGNVNIELDIFNFPKQFYSPSGNTEFSKYWFDVFVGDTQYIEIKMTMNPIVDGNTQSTVVKGVVIDYMGKPIPNATVALHKKENFHEGYHMNVPYFWADYQLETDSLGNFLFDYIWGGDYVAFSFAKDRNFIPVFYPASSDPFSSEVINIIEGNNDTIVLEFMLKPGSTITGYVKNRDGGNVTDTTIKVELHPNYENTSSTTTPMFNLSFETKIDNNGKFFLQGIPAGNWHINAWDENSLWAMHMWYNEEIITDGTNPLNKFPEIIMKAGGNIYGTFASEIQDSNMYHHWNLGRLFPIVENFQGYPQFTDFYDDSISSDTMIHEDSMDYEPTLEEEALWTWIEVRTDTTKGMYKSSAIPAGNMRFIFSPEVYFDTWNFAKSDSIIKPSARWSYIDGATTLSNSKLFMVNEGESQKFDFRISSGGYAILGNLTAEGGEIFRASRSTRQTSEISDSSDITGPRWYNIKVFVKESGHFLKVAESFHADSNQFILNGLIDNQEYYFFMEADGYPWQWYTGLKDSTTSNPDSAKPYLFDAATYSKLQLYMQKQPHDFEDWNDEWENRPSEIKNLTFTTVGLKAIQLNWSHAPEDENVVKYRIFRLKAQTALDLKNLFVWDSSHGGWEPVDENSIMQNLDSMEVVDTFFIDTKIAPDSVYMYVVFAVNSKGEEGMALHENPILDSYITSINLSTLKSTKTYATNKWQMIGIPGTETITATSNPLDTSSKMFIYYWDEEADSTGVYSKYQKTNTLSPSNGYWLYSNEAVTGEITEEDIKKLYPQLGNINVTLKVGWNQISSPYPYPVYPSFVNDTMVLHYYNISTGGYETPEVMQPWKGYWIYSDKIDTLPISETPAKAVKKRRSRLNSLKRWDIAIQLKGNNYNDLNNFIGTINSRTSITSLEPPSAFGAPQLYILEDGQKLSKSYKRASASEQKWSIALSPSKENMTIEFANLKSVPDDVMLIWTDGSVIKNLKEENAISIPSHNDERYGTVVATSNPNTIALFSGAFILNQNYPNPFRGITNFEFTIPYSFNDQGKIQSSDNTKVSLDIFNMAGRKVTTILNKEMRVGTHRTLWDSKNLSTGVYLARLKAGKFIKTVKLFKIQ